MTTDMKICVISDTHNLHRMVDVPECDLLIHCGDACGSGSMRELGAFANWFSDLSQAKHKIYVPGNHDIFVQQDTMMAVSFFQEGVRVLIDEAVEIDGVKIYGFPWTPAFCGWAFQANDGVRDDSPRYLDMAYYLSNVPEDTDILVTHGPPRGIMDKNEYGEACGSKETRRQYESGKLKPKIHCFGHIHEGYGVMSQWGTAFVNAAMSIDYSTIRRDPITINLRADGSVGF